MGSVRHACVALLVASLAASWAAGCNRSTRTVIQVPTPSHPENGAPGARARDYLTASTCTSLKIEVDYVTGRAPSQTALAFFKHRIEERCNKFIADNPDVETR